MKIEISLDLSPLRLFGGLAIVALCASCVPSRSANGFASQAAIAATPAKPTAQLDPREREQVSRKVAQLLVPASGSPAAPFDGNSQSPDDQQRSLDCLTAAIYYEARSESEDGQRAVAQVVLNRVRHPAYPASVCGVVYQGSHRTTGCQFSFTCDGSMNRGRRDPITWIRARRLAAEALAGSVYAPVGNATHYHTTAIMPYWARYLRRSIVVGAHIFYRWAGNAGEASAFRQTYGGLEPAPSLYRASGVAANIAGVTVHRGSAPSQPTELADAAAAAGTAAPTPAPARKWREEISLDGGGTVTVHRGAAPQQNARRDASTSGVKVHAGLPPELG